jgi:methyl-accepting chemotaxis protein
MMNVWIYRAVKPAARVMDRLRFPRKLLTMAAVFLVPAVLCTALLTSVLQRDIGFVQRELRGTSAEQPLTDLVVAVERHRGLMARQLNGDTTLGADIANQTDRIDAGFAALAAWSRADGAVLHVDDQLAAAAAAWSQLKQSSSPDAAKADDAHVELLDKLVDLSGAIADASNLTLDPEMSTYALMDLTTGRALRATRTIGALRDYGAVTLNAGTALDAQMLGRLMMSYGAARDEFKPLGSDLQRALQADTGVAEALDGKLKAATDAANAFLALTKAQIVDVTKAGVSGKDYFEAGSRAVTAIGDLSAAATPQLTRLLQLRLHAATQRLYLALAVSAAAGLLAVYLYYGFLRSLSATVRGLRRATTQITQRQYPGNIDLFSTDEMQEIAGELEKIAAALKHSEAEQKLRLDEAAKLKTSLDVASVGVMFANVDGIIEFANGSAVRMFDAAAEQVRKLDPAFDAAQLVGRSFDLFHRDREHQRRLLATLQETYRTRVRIGSGIYDIAVSPVFGSEGQRLGAVIEWIDRTAQVSVDEQMEKLVEAAAEGDFSGRIVADKLDAGLRKRADALNKLMEAVSGGLQDLDRVLSAIADGDLTQTVERQGKGLFGKLYGNANSTVRQLAQAVGQMKLAAESVKVASGEISAGNADLSRRTEQQAASLEETSSPARSSRTRTTPCRPPSWRAVPARWRSRAARWSATSWKR